MSELEQFQFDPDIPTKNDMENIEKFKSSILQYTYELLQNQQCQRVLEHIYTYLFKCSTFILKCTFQPGLR